MAIRVLKSVPSIKSVFKKYSCYSSNSCSNKNGGWDSQSPLALPKQRKWLFVALFVLVDLYLHSVDAIRHSLLKGVGLLAVEERLARQGQRNLCYLVIVTLGFVHFEEYFALGGVVYQSFQFSDFVAYEFFKLRVCFEFH